MSIFYDNLPLPVYLAITFLVPILIYVYFYKRKSEYPITFLIGIVFAGVTAFSTGLVRVSREFKLYEEYSYLFGSIIIPFILLTALFIMIGAYQKGKDDEIKRRKILAISFILVLIVSFFVFLGVFKPWE